MTGGMSARVFRRCFEAGIDDMLLFEAGVDGRDRVELWWRRLIAWRRLVVTSLG